MSFLPCPRLPACAGEREARIKGTEGMKGWSLHGHPQPKSSTFIACFHRQRKDIISVPNLPSHPATFLYFTTFSVDEYTYLDADYLSKHISCAFGVPAALGAKLHGMAVALLSPLSHFRASYRRRRGVLTITLTHTIPTFPARLHDADKDDERTSVSPVSILELALPPTTVFSSTAFSAGGYAYLDAAYLSKFKRIFGPSVSQRLWSRAAPTGTGTIAPTFGPSRRIGARHTHPQQPTAIALAIALVQTKSCALSGSQSPMARRPESITTATLRQDFRVSLRRFLKGIPAQRRSCLLRRGAGGWWRRLTRHAAVLRMLGCGYKGREVVRVDEAQWLAGRRLHDEASNRHDGDENMEMEVAWGSCERAVLVGEVVNPPPRNACTAGFQIHNRLPSLSMSPCATQQHLSPSSTRANIMPTAARSFNSASTCAHRAAASSNVDTRTRTATSLSCLPWNPPPRPERLGFVAEPHLHTFSGNELEIRLKKSL
ncbi:hypothetical protein FIBSPDRAFT_900671 [Athelia psychrophila]|uniref:Uncharacterized protein n=1 Tax=Athelia psychrophila TaxID=1759441 RepID=A0A165Y4U4_9AGAM|nr:hypothetical protein FIBSPDRAFT_900671 [Fibularhizoctonia sp. CBS 109695]